MENSPNCQDIFILSGQSNMSGRGGVVTLDNRTRIWDQVVPEEANPPASCLILRLSAELQWEIAKEPLHYDIDHDKVCGVGPGLVFAASFLRLLKEKGEETNTIGLVPCAIGGTSIVEWEKGGRLYEQMINRAKSALRGGGTLKALLWYQGESDAVTKELAEAYQTRLERFFTDVRYDLKAENLPILQVKITGTWPFCEEIRAAQSSIRVPGVYNTDAWGLPLNPDNIHLTRESQTKVGTALAEKYVNDVLCVTRSRC
ncbi:hypothetical protein R1flu_018707 [Riccia fluitans]|uniref:Sialate O-acetylesterase domain-containing protein n=1 Tax=Riccia fluitans TaxID=41844 RepID=A0ABD1ZGL9_9MARC